MTPPQITLHCATTSSGSRQTILPPTCSTLMQKKATLSPPFPLCYLTERWVDLQTVHVWVVAGGSFSKRYTVCHLHVSNAASEQSEENLCLWEDCVQVSRRRCQMSVSPFSRLTEARQRDDCFFSRVTNARTLIGFAGGRGILAVVRHLAHSLIEVKHTHPPALVVSNKPGWKPPIRNCWNHGGKPPWWAASQATVNCLIEA